MRQIMLFYGTLSLFRCKRTSSKNLLVKWANNIQSQQRNTTNQGPTDTSIVFIADFEEVYTN